MQLTGGPELQIKQLKFELSENRYYNNNRCYGFRILFQSKLLKFPSIWTYTFLGFFCHSDHSLLRIRIPFQFICSILDVWAERFVRGWKKNNKLVANLLVTASSHLPRERKLSNMVRFTIQYEPPKLIKFFININRDSSISK